MSRRVAAATLVLLALVALVLFADRPVAVWFDTQFHGSSAERIVIAAFAMLDWILLIAGVALLAGVIVVRRRPQTAWLKALVSGGVATVIALATAQAIKFLFGRSQVYPDFLRDGIYTLHPFHGGAFPSATMAGTTAFVIGLNLRRPVERVVVAAVTVVFAMALLITSGHWSSDIVGGTVLGLLVGRARDLRPGSEADPSLRSG